MKSPYIHCDESAFSVYNEEQRKVQNVSIWALSDALGPGVLFQYELGKKNNEIARSLLKSYNGTVQTDASALYEQFEKDPTKVMRLLDPLSTILHRRSGGGRSDDEDLYCIHQQAVHH